MPSRNYSIVQTLILVAFAAAKDFSICSELILGLPDGKRLTPDTAVYPQLVLAWTSGESVFCG